MREKGVENSAVVQSLAGIQARRTKWEEKGLLTLPTSFTVKKLGSSCTN